eukprot:scaffold227282_cov24-Prasinocladus_malaysianus.AAC.1
MYVCGHHQFLVVAGELFGERFEPRHLPLLLDVFLGHHLHLLVEVFALGLFSQPAAAGHTTCLTAFFADAWPPARPGRSIPAPVCQPLAGRQQQPPHSPPPRGFEPPVRCPAGLGPARTPELARLLGPGPETRTTANVK